MHRSLFRAWAVVSALLVSTILAMPPRAEGAAAGARTPVRDLPACAAANLRASLLLQGATGSLAGSIILTNHGGFACGLSVRPEIRMIDGHGRVLAIIYVKARGDVEGAPVGMTELLPGGQAAVFTVWDNWCHGAIAGPVVVAVTLPQGGGVLKVSPQPGGQGRFTGPRCDVPGRRSALAVAPFEPGYSAPAETIRYYYQAINSHQYRAAYIYVAPAGRAPFAAFAQGYGDTARVSLDLLAVPRYIIGGSAVSYTCAGLQMHVRRTDGSEVEFGGWYLVQVKLQSTGFLVIPGSSMAPNRPLTVPSRSDCARAIPSSPARRVCAAAPAPTTVLGAVDFLSPAHGWIELSSSAGYSPGCQTGTHPAPSCNRATTSIYETSDAGRSWTLRLRFTGATLAYIGAGSLPGLWMHFFDSRHGLVMVAAGTDRGTLYRTADGGASWTSRSLPRQAGPVESTDIAFVDWRHLWLLAHEGAAMGSELVSVYRTQDAGDNWLRVACTPVPAPGGPGEAGCHARSGVEFGGHKGYIVFANLADGFLADNNFSGIPFLYVTRDGGYHWTALRPGLPRGVQPPGAKTGTYAEYRQPIFIGHLGILPTTVNTCRQVKPAQSSCTYGLYALLSHDGGRSWPMTRRIPSPAGAQVEPVWQVMDGSTWWSVTRRTVWRTADSGAHWTAIRSHIPAGFELVAIQFLDGRSGWAIAARENRQQGVLYGTRLLHTLDAGAHWSSISLPPVR